MKIYVLVVDLWDVYRHSCFNRLYTGMWPCLKRAGLKEFVVVCLSVCELVSSLELLDWCFVEFVTKSYRAVLGFTHIDP
jgi:hypothetical protein